MTLREWVTGRVRAIIDAGHAAELTRAWPTGVPGLKVDGHTEEQLERIAAACSSVEAAHRMPFGDPDPRLPAAEPLVSGPLLDAPNVQHVDEGEMVDPEEVAALLAAVGALPPPAAELVATCARLAHEAGVSISVTGRRRRVEIAKALVAISHLPVADAFDLIAEATGAPDHADAGVVLGAMTVEQAHRLLVAAGRAGTTNQQPTLEGASNQ